MVNCEEFVDLVIKAAEAALKVAKSLLADMDALDRWADDGGPSRD